METKFTETEILNQLDKAFNGIPGNDYPEGGPGDVKYHFFLDLEHGYCLTAGSRIHLYADNSRWAVILEKSGYQTGRMTAEAELNYVGNCIQYSVAHYPTGNYITNTQEVILIDSAEFERIENKEGEEPETFERIGKQITEIQIRDNFVTFDSNPENYEKVGIHIQKDDNPNQLIGFGDFVRYLYETNPQLLCATESELRNLIPNDLPKIMTIHDFHYSSAYDKATPPSQQETYQLIAKVLTTGDSSHWKPVEEPNNSWKNWESGHL